MTDIPYRDNGGIKPSRIDDVPSMTPTDYSFDLHPTLYYAVLHGRSDVVKACIKNNDNVSEIDREYGENVLHYAARVGNFKLVRLFIENGANPDIETQYPDSVDNYIAIELAGIAGHKKIVRYLAKFKTMSKKAYVTFLVERYGHEYESRGISVYEGGKNCDMESCVYSAYIRTSMGDAPVEFSDRCGNIDDLTTYNWNRCIWHSAPPPVCESPKWHKHASKSARAIASGLKHGETRFTVQSVKIISTDREWEGRSSGKQRMFEKCFHVVREPYCRRSGDEDSDDSDISM